ncbi:hypothetical protein Y032_0395g648 [Ancylostoma ceylanicum]|uniref:G-protein coupled receptors family 1 profile domain-containing protein n=2 Tax=Ancylostoma ceylanicum TaxID=53326 RepID=A0A016RSA8_9BILA|nr:hypothetical protein Y032_0395g648 [Ancylostoma ceylanicum]
MSEEESHCSEAAAFIAFIPQSVSMSTHILLCFVALVTNCIFVQFSSKQLNFHFNCRILILTLVSINCAHSTVYSSLLVYHLIKIHSIHENLCDVMTDGRFCFPMRLTTSACYIGHTTVFFGLLLERCLATRYMATYERSSHRAGYTIACCSVLSAFLLSWFKIRLFNMGQRTVYCSSVTAETYTDVLITHSLLLMLLTITVIIFGFIFLQNRRVTKRVARNVSEKYQATENIRALRMLAPLLIFHFICYPLYFTVSIITQSIRHLVGTLYFRVIFSAVYCPSYYCVLSPLILLYIIRKKASTNEKTIFTVTTGKPQREEDIYFQNYRTMW